LFCEIGGTEVELVVEGAPPIVVRHDRLGEKRHSGGSRLEEQDGDTERSRSRRGSKGSPVGVELSSESSLERAGEVIGAAAEHSPSFELPRHNSAAKERGLTEGAAL
jgi:hypothetical protein